MLNRMTETPTSDPHSELRGMLDGASRWADEWFAEHGVLNPMWHIACADGREMVLASPHPDKDAAALIVRAVFRQLDAVRCIYVDEAWTVEIKLNNRAEVERVMRDGASGHPRRQEIVMFSGEDQFGALIGVRRIERPADAKPYLGPLDVEAPPASEGRFVGMLPQRGARQ
jgi:hypothetical protein